jgi:hypothetical protein
MLSIACKGTQETPNRSVAGIRFLVVRQCEILLKKVQTKVQTKCKHF